MNYENFKNIIGEKREKFIDKASLFSVKNRCRQNGLFDNNKIINLVKKHNDEIDKKESFIANLNSSNNFWKFITRPSLSTYPDTKYFEYFILNKFDCLFDLKSKEFESKIKEILEGYISNSVIIFDKESKTFEEKNINILEKEDFKNIVINSSKKTNMFFYDINKKYAKSKNSSIFDILSDVVTYLPSSKLALLFQSGTFDLVSSDFLEFFIDNILNTEQKNILLTKGLKDSDIKDLCHNYAIPTLRYEDQERLKNKNIYMYDNYFNKFYEKETLVLFSDEVFNKIRNIFNENGLNLDLSRHDVYSKYIKKHKKFKDNDMYFNLILIN